MLRIRIALFNGARIVSKFIDQFALSVSVGSQVTELIKELQEEFGALRIATRKPARLVLTEIGNRQGCRRRGELVDRSRPTRPRCSTHAAEFVHELNNGLVWHTLWQI